MSDNILGKRKKEDDNVFDELSKVIEKLKKKVKTLEGDVRQLKGELKDMSNHVSSDETGWCSECGIVLYTWGLCESEVFRPPECMGIEEDEDYGAWIENRMCWMCRRDLWGDDD